MRLGAYYRRLIPAAPPGGRERSAGHRPVDPGPTAGSLEAAWHPPGGRMLDRTEENSVSLVSVKP